MINSPLSSSSSSRAGPNASSSSPRAYRVTVPWLAIAIGGVPSHHRHHHSRQRSEENPLSSSPLHLGTDEGITVHCDPHHALASDNDGGVSSNSGIYDYEGHPLCEGIVVFGGGGAKMTMAASSPNTVPASSTDEEGTHTVIDVASHCGFYRRRRGSTTSSFAATNVAAASPASSEDTIARCTTSPFDEDDDDDDDLLDPFFMGNHLRLELPTHHDVWSLEGLEGCDNSPLSDSLSSFMMPSSLSDAYHLINEDAAGFHQLPAARCLADNNSITCMPFDLARPAMSKAAASLAALLDDGPATDHTPPVCDADPAEEDGYATWEPSCYSLAPPELVAHTSGQAALEVGSSSFVVPLSSSRLSSASPSPLCPVGGTQWGSADAHIHVTLL